MAKKTNKMVTPVLEPGVPTPDLNVPEPDEQANSETRTYFETVIKPCELCTPDVRRRDQPTELTLEGNQVKAWKSGYAVVFVYGELYHVPRGKVTVFEMTQVGDSPPVVSDTIA